jgi:hypothetical protein
MNQDQVDAVVADMLRAGFGKGLKDLYRDLRDQRGAFGASLLMVVACRKLWLRDFGEPLPGSYRWWRIFDRLNDLTWSVVDGL